MRPARLALLAAAVGCLLLFDPGQAAEVAPAACAGLAGGGSALKIEPTLKIASADARPAAGAVPAHCEVVGKLQERAGANGQTYAIRFRLRLPEQWNGRLFFQGGNGTNGVIGNAMGALLGAQTRTALELGYAVVSQDSGHDNAANNDPRRQGALTFGWDAEARHNFGGAAILPVARVAKALIHDRYGRSPAYSYYVGGSKGGQEGLYAAQHFPAEFDGVLAGFPAMHLAQSSVVGQTGAVQAFAAAAKALGQIGPDGSPLVNRSISDEDLALASNAVASVCDALDGTYDGIVDDFQACTTARVAPALRSITCKGAKTAACLLPVQVEALRLAHDGVRDARGRPLYSAFPWDPGVGGRTPQGWQQGWRAWNIGAYASASNDARALTLSPPANSAVFASPPEILADEPTAFVRYGLSLDIPAATRRLDVKWGRFHESANDFMKSDATDMSAFARRGGKMLIFHGTDDAVVSIHDTIDWLNRVDRREGGRAARFLRLFAVPGMNHAGGGAATDQIDAFSALIAWREKGEAPTSLVGRAGPNTPWPGRTRLLCAYPQKPRKVGDDLESAASFRCGG